MNPHSPFLSALFFIAFTPLSYSAEMRDTFAIVIGTANVAEDYCRYRAKLRERGHT
jgi:hypothetical protein